ncbi:hypothetical protein AVEN_55706-1, partial [Araneus ventricosus]
MDRILNRGNDEDDNPSPKFHTTGRALDPDELSRAAP